MSLNIEPKSVFGFFEEISQIPRGSGNEEAISKYLEKFAIDRNLEYVRDSANNVIIKKPGSKGYENSPAVILQGHSDMVCEKEEGSTHDFLKDPLKLKVEGDLLSATGTTLGGDNGIAVAYALAVLDDDSIEHPPVEVVITTDEETGMGGARALDASLLKAKRLINLDSEEEGYLLVSCCGGRRVNVNIPVRREEVSGYTILSVSVGGLKGGHSGAEIHLQRANANKLMGRVLKALSETADLRIVSVNGGNVDNAITRDCCAIIAVKDSDVEAVKEKAATIADMLCAEYKGIEDQVLITVTENVTELKPIVKEDGENVIRVINLIPFGVRAMSKDIKDLVETSCNLGIIATDEDCIRFGNSVRSSVTSRKEALCSKFEDIAFMAGGSCDMHADYPGWEFNPDSDLLKLFKKTFVEVYGKEPVVMAMHAGLECGLFAEKMPGVDMISIGPDMWDVHTPQERLSIKSVASTWEFIKAVLKNMK